ncbi:hypothetical protein HZA43_02130 [Candidatus Peregrinibacteria bacterium]|nr:hypothetical protein [Candidatus Peregrinibacteria bacterium]
MSATIQETPAPKRTGFGRAARAAALFTLAMGFIMAERPARAQAATASVPPPKGAACLTLVGDSGAAPTGPVVVKMDNAAVAPTTPPGSVACTGLFFGDLVSGKKTFEIAADGYKPVSLDLTVSAGGVTPQSVALQRTALWTAQKAARENFDLQVEAAEKALAQAKSWKGKADLWWVLRDSTNVVDWNAVNATLGLAPDTFTTFQALAAAGQASGVIERQQRELLAEVTGTSFDAFSVIGEPAKAGPPAVAATGLYLAVETKFSEAKEALLKLVRAPVPAGGSAPADPNIDDPATLTAAKAAARARFVTADSSVQESVKAEMALVSERNRSERAEMALVSERNRADTAERARDAARRHEDSAERELGATRRGADAASEMGMLHVGSPMPRLAVLGRWAYYTHPNPTSGQRPVTGTGKVLRADERGLTIDTEAGKVFVYYATLCKDSPAPAAGAPCVTFAEDHVLYVARFSANSRWSEWFARAQGGANIPGGGASFLGIVEAGRFYQLSDYLALYLALGGAGLASRAERATTGEANGMGTVATGVRFQTKAGGAFVDLGVRGFAGTSLGGGAELCPGLKIGSLEFRACLEAAQFTGGAGQNFGRDLKGDTTHVGVGFDAGYKWEW